MAINKVVYGEDTLIDLTEDTVKPESLLKGYTAHGAHGELINGTFEQKENNIEVVFFLKNTAGSSPRSYMEFKNNGYKKLYVKNSSATSNTRVLTMYADGTELGKLSQNMGKEYDVSNSNSIRISTEGSANASNPVGIEVQGRAMLYN